MSGLNQQGMTQGWCREIPNTRSERSGPKVAPPPFRTDSVRQNLANLTKVIEAEIIPRLMLVHNSPDHSNAVTAPLIERDSVEQEDVNEFTRLILTHDASVAASFVHALLAGGLRLETLYLDLFSAAARQLGDRWEAELADFTEVTMGLWRLQQLLHDLSPTFQRGVAATAKARSALLVPAPGEQHTFGLFMVAEFFRRASWNVWSELPRSHDDLIATVRGNHFDMFGMSVAHDCTVEEMSKTIAGVRSQSKNRSIGVMVGGPMFIKHPELVAIVGADMTAIDGGKAVQQAESLLVLQETS